MATATISPAGTLTIGELFDAFLERRMAMVDSGELCSRTHDHYKRADKFIRAQFSDDVLVADLRPDDFFALRQAMSVNCGVFSLANRVQSVRTIFKWAYESELLDRPMRFGPGFKKPAAKMFRKSRRERGVMMFEADELAAKAVHGKPFEHERARELFERVSEFIS